MSPTLRLRSRLLAGTVGVAFALSAAMPLAPAFAYTDEQPNEENSEYSHNNQDDDSGSGVGTALGALAVIGLLGAAAVAAGDNDNTNNNYYNSNGRSQSEADAATFCRNYARRQAKQHGMRHIKQNSVTNIKDIGGNDRYQIYGYLRGEYPGEGKRTINYRCRMLHGNLNNFDAYF